MTTNIVGCIAEYKFAVFAMERGLQVSFPLLNTSPYDCIVQSKKGLFKIQIKSVKKTRKNNRVFLRHADGKSYNNSDVDFFAVYFERMNGFFIFKYSDVKKSVKLDSKKYLKNFNNFAIL